MKIRCAELEMGKNSVSPWINASTVACHMDKVDLRSFG